LVLFTRLYKDARSTKHEIIQHNSVHRGTYKHTAYSDGFSKDLWHTLFQY